MDNYQTRMYAELSPDARRLFHALAGLMTPDEWRAAVDLLPNGERANCSTGCGRTPSSTRRTSSRSCSGRDGSSPGRVFRRNPCDNPVSIVRELRGTRVPADARLSPVPYSLARARADGAAPEDDTT